MKLGDTLTAAGAKWKVRPFTAAEHQLFDTVAEPHDLERKAAQLQAMASTRGGTAREALLKADQKRIQKRLTAFTSEDGGLREDLTEEDGGLREDLTEEERVTAYEVALELDMLTEKLEALREERTIEALLLEEELTQARESVVITFMHQVMNVDQPVDVFTAALTPDEIADLDEAVMLGKLRLGLSASTRRQQAAFTRTLAQLQSQQQSGGSASGSRQQQPAAPQKPGKPGRSKRSSSKSKAGS